MKCVICGFGYIVENTVGGPMQTPEFFWHRIVTNSKNKANEKESEKNTYLTRFDNCLRSRSRRGERSSSNQSIYFTINRDHILFYISRELTKKKKLKALNTDKKWTQNPTWKPSITRVCRQPGGPVDRLHNTQLSGCRYRQPWGELSMDRVIAVNMPQWLSVVV